VLCAISNLWISKYIRFINFWHSWPVQFLKLKYINVNKDKSKLREGLPWWPCSDSHESLRSIRRRRWQRWYCRWRSMLSMGMQDYQWALSFRQYTFYLLCARIRPRSRWPDRIAAIRDFVFKYHYISSSYIYNTFLYFLQFNSFAILLI